MSETAVETLIVEPTPEEVAEFAAVLGPAIATCQARQLGFRMRAYWDEQTGKLSHVRARTTRGREVFTRDRPLLDGLQAFTAQLEKPLPSGATCDLMSLSEQLLRALRIEHPLMKGLAFQASFNVSSTILIFRCWIETYKSGDNWGKTIGEARSIDATAAVSKALDEAHAHLLSLESGK